MQNKTPPQAEVLSENGRDGKIDAADGSLSVDFRPGSDGQSAPTPEHLFAGAYAACFHSALKSLAASAHQDIAGSTVVATARVAENGGSGSVLAVTLRASIPGVSESDARHLLHQAHEKCPYSRAVRNNVTVTLALD
jgi:Ohr subfamily peroxiredoxin